MAIGYHSNRSEILPAFIRYDCVSDVSSRLDPADFPAELLRILRTSAMSGATSSAGKRIDGGGYFGPSTTCTSSSPSLRCEWVVADHEVPLVGASPAAASPSRFRDHSLLKAIDCQIFDDLLIGNFMQTTLARAGPSRSLPQRDSLYREIRRQRSRPDERGTRPYFAEYRRRLGAMRYFRHMMERTARRTAQAHLRADSSGLLRARSAHVSTDCDPILSASFR